MYHWFTFNTLEHTGRIPILPWENVILLVILTCGTFLHQLTHLGYRKRNSRSTSSMPPDGAPITPTWPRDLVSRRPSLFHNVTLRLSIDDIKYTDRPGDGVETNVAVWDLMFCWASSCDPGNSQRGSACASTLLPCVWKSVGCYWARCLRMVIMVPTLKTEVLH
jgi:hypothetical protein